MYINRLHIPQFSIMSIFFLIVFSVSFEYAPLSNKRTLAKVDFEIGVQRTNLKNCVLEMR